MSSQLTLIEILEKNGIDFQTDHRDVRQGWIGLQCPWCGGPDEYYLGIHIAGDYPPNCWRCGPHSLANVLAECLNIGIGEAIQKSREMASPAFQSERRQDDRVLNLTQFWGKLEPVHREYLRSRGFNSRQIEKLWQVGGIGPRSQWAWRLFIPAYEKGRLVSWTTRSINPEASHSDRYRAAPEDRERKPLKSILYGGDYCRHACVVVEGPTGAWRIGPGVVATNGLGVSPAQLKLISEYPVRAIVFDHEKEAQRRAKKLCDALSIFPGETYLVDLDSADPGEATKKEVRQIRKHFLE